MSKILGYVTSRLKITEPTPFYSVDVDSYNLAPDGSLDDWVHKSYWEEVDAPDPLTEKNDPIKPDHYHSGGIDVFTYIEANLSKESVIGYHQGSAIKYIIRAGKKGSSLQDFKKAQSHLDKLKELSE